MEPNPSDFDNEERTLYKALEDFMLMAVNNKGLRAMADFLSDVYQAPVSMIDNVYSVIAFSRHRLPDDPNIAKELTSGHLTIEPSQMIKGILTPAHATNVGKSTRIKIPGSAVSIVNYITPIQIHNTVLAYFSVFTDEKGLSEIQESFLIKFANLLALEMQKSSFYTSHKSRYFTHLLSTVLENDSPEALVDIGKRFELFGYHLLTYKRVIFVDIQEAFYNNADLSLIAQRLYAIIPNSIYVLQESSVVFLSTQEEPAPLSQNVLDSIRQAVKGISALVGISGEFINIEQTAQYRLQAKGILEDAKKLLPGTSVVSFDDVRFCDLILHTAEYTNLRPYQYPPLVKLIHFDEENDTNLVETLVCYLENPRKQPEVCEKLHIHRNTLYYRLAKIREITDVDIDNGYVIAQIFTSLAILGCQTSRWEHFHPF